MILQLIHRLILHNKHASLVLIYNNTENKTDKQTKTAKLDPSCCNALEMILTNVHKVSDTDTSKSSFTEDSCIFRYTLYLNQSYHIAEI